MVQAKYVKEETHDDIPASGESLMMKRVLLKPQIKTMCKAKGKGCKLIIDNGNTDNLVSTKMVEKLGLKKIAHPTPYKVSWMHIGFQVLVNEQCQVEFQIGTYRDQVLCDVMPIDVCHLL